MTNQSKCSFTDICDTMPCLNGGQCSIPVLAPTSYQCTCQSGFTGINCETCKYQTATPTENAISTLLLTCKYFCFTKWYICITLLASYHQ